MHHLGTGIIENGASGGPFVVTVASDGKLMHFRDTPYSLPDIKQEGMNSNMNQASSSKSDVYQYVVNAAGGSGHYMGLMTVGPDGKLVSLRNDRSTVSQQPSSTAVIDFNGGKDTKSVLLQINPLHSHHAVAEAHPQIQQPKSHQDQHRNDSNSISHPSGAVIDFNTGKDPKTVVLQVHPAQTQMNLHAAQNIHHSQITHHQGNISHQLLSNQQTHQQNQQVEPRQPLQQHQRQQAHQQVLRTDKIVKGDREVVCAKSCRACCKFDDDETPDHNSYIQQSPKEDNNIATSPVSWTTENPASFSPSVKASSPNGPSKGARFQCKVCLKMFTQKVNLTAHERIHLGERPFQCKTCLKSFTQQSNLVTHERIHTGERPYQCQVCMKRFTQRQNLTAHERIHLGERPFTCQVCNKSFTQSQNLTAHERIHLGERPFQCQVCLKSFTQQQNLTSHERIHHLEKQFTCNVCLRVFSQESSLQRHMQTHTNSERPYTCQVCHRTFAQQSSLLVHEWVHKSPERRKRNFTYVNVEENVMEIPSSEQSEETAHDRNHTSEQEAEKNQGQCLPGSS
ncbi:Zinc finger protein 568 [Frankliniella fusca]|uniref:Zinc finger protein 568 n=1 Tax=Frankliniella fusca TaxID=407009 RepID=A0AAE1LTK9_9NEOP|nr:Zinc finger protein 568 [Frankliniella fusca]